MGRHKLFFKRLHQIFLEQYLVRRVCWKYLVHVHIIRKRRACRVLTKCLTETKASNKTQVQMKRFKYRVVLLQRYDRGVLSVLAAKKRAYSIQWGAAHLAWALLKQQMVLAKTNANGSMKLGSIK